MGYLAVILSSILFGIIPSIQENVMASGATPLAMVMINNGVACITALILSLVQRRRLLITRRQLLDLILIGAIGLFTTDFLLDVSYTLIPVGYVTMIHFLYPTLVVIFWLFSFMKSWVRAGR